MKTCSEFRSRLPIIPSARLAFCAALLLSAVSPFAGCRLPGKPGEGPEVPRPEQITNFDTLYGSNCAGCHGVNGQNGSAMNLANPVYQGIVDDATLRDVIAGGEAGTLMPAFGAKQGGTLTDAQIDAIVTGMRARWNKGNVLAGQNAPAYKAAYAGDAAKGEQAYQTTCAQCHEAAPQKPAQGGSIRDGSFLALVNEQTIRTTMIAGRPDLGMPDWRRLVKGRALTDDEITDVTAWLMAQKPATPGQPYPGSGQMGPARTPMPNPVKQ
ncbi:c-type cytochrome [Terracidiphilus sp.]|uniref:c-type cytochrome n=1 Tax=Terracidiphilus sp. TaxID=1964191 RepID=UPI003C169109